jgi:DNA-directed RNA polymerase sigma subunit (sigma70/sigma32)
VSKNPNGMTLDQVGYELGCTRERIRQIEAIALIKLRRAIEREGIDLSTFLDGWRDECVDHGYQRPGRNAA